MKKTFLLLLAAVCASIATAQNIQLHYDFGRHLYPDVGADRQPVTVTLEQFKADRLGSWFYFVDLDLDRKVFQGAYAEISREFNLWKQAPWAAHVEYNGGCRSFTDGSFQHAVLVGPAWNGHNADFTKTYSVQLLYKQYFRSYDASHAFASFQLTGVWNLLFAKRAMTFAGYIDFWRGEKANHHGKLIVMAEPQLWYNLNTLPQMEGINLSVGTEVEVSNNFVFNAVNSTTFFVNPTLALKWSF